MSHKSDANHKSGSKPKKRYTKPCNKLVFSQIEKTCLLFLFDFPIFDSWRNK